MKNGFPNSKLFALLLQKAFICVKTISIYFNAIYKGAINEGTNCLYRTH